MVSEEEDVVECHATATAPATATAVTATAGGCKNSCSGVVATILLSDAPARGNTAGAA